MAYSGRYRPSQPKKYKGDPTNIIYRSLWERKFMVWCDKNENVLQWGSEEIVIPYVSPVDRRVHRYFPDFYVKARTRNNVIKKYIVEVKPEKQCMVPKRPKRQTKKYITEVKTYGINQAKWKAATEYCLDRNMEFMILTEKHLKV
ncbi:head completion protein [Cyanophage P-TIM40]|uniref:Head completion nuclease n=1 Tax=Cyanophage P-TIM40 TaxID=1589733 RepID=A0A0C5ADT0_9CAUD|nr:TnsA endonuclease N-terminal domain-containing protein [Nonlabens xiamenensis]YP_009188090.1 head closure [Cyanophage P-TIM40]AJK27442.1 head completion protein [Cyanophage P-TIM40]|tara:strand:+ start:3534 stop:3968 length:435 start_codon:yes stop_codon:yes gene_type:complete